RNALKSTTIPSDTRAPPYLWWLHNARIRARRGPQPNPDSSRKGTGNGRRFRAGCESAWRPGSFRGPGTKRVPQEDRMGRGDRPPRLAPPGGQLRACLGRREYWLWREWFVVVGSAS